jgi:hypothetical protein
MRSPSRLALAVALPLLLGTWPAPVAAEGPGDGLYGRWDGDWSLHVGAGAGASWETSERQATLLGELRLRYVDAAGPVLSGRWGPDGGEHLFVGVELRPLFPALFLEGLSTGWEFVDLLIQSLGIEVGVAWLPLNGDTGAGLGVGLGMEAPLVLPSWWGDGVWLRFGTRYVRAQPSDRSGPQTELEGWTLYATIAVKAIFGHAVSTWEPRRYRR